MSGHSKWSKVKHQKATTDVVKGQAFTRASRAITMAVREGGGTTDPETNFKLRLAIEKAKEVNMPKENIKHAIDRAAGAGSGDLIETLYEGFGPYGVAIIISSVTDNRQRTVSAVKNILERHGGTLAAPGAVTYLFSHVGVITIPKSSHTYEEIMEKAIDAGASDIVETDDVYEIFTSSADLSKAKEHLEQVGMAIDRADLVYRTQTPVAVAPGTLSAVVSLVIAIEELDDVQAVYTNIT